MKFSNANAIAVLFWLPAFAAAQGRSDLQFQLSYTGHHSVQVAMRYTPVENDSTVFSYGEPMFGGQPDIISCMANARVNAPARIRTDPVARTFSIYHNGHDPVTIEYEILDTATVRKDVRKELFRPMIQPDYFYSHGVNLFLNPRFRDSTIKATMSLEWIKPPDFPLFYGFDPENGGKSVAYSTVDSVLFSLMTGAADLTVDRFALHGTQNYIVLRGGPGNDNDRKAVRDYFTRFNQAIRRFWNDYSDPCFSLVLQPFLEADHNIGGVAYANGFIGKYRPDTIISPHRIYTISHEVGHHWIGHKLEMDISNQWFGEGFNDYITFITLFSSGLLSANDFENRMNEVFRLHYSSSIRNLPNDSVFRNYWKMGDYNKLPYRRGCLFAFYLDNQVRLNSDGKKTIRDLLLALAEFRKTMPPKYEIKVEEFIQQASAFLPKEKLQSVLDEYIMKGNPIPFTNDMLIPVFRMEMEKEIPRILITDENRFKALFTF